MSDERYEAAVREVLDYLPAYRGDAEARVIVDRVLACGFVPVESAGVAAERAANNAASCRFPECAYEQEAYERLRKVAQAAMATLSVPPERSKSVPPTGTERKR